MGHSDNRADRLSLRRRALARLVIPPVAALAATPQVGLCLLLIRLTDAGRRPPLAWAL